MRSQAPDTLEFGKLINVHFALALNLQFDSVIRNEIDPQFCYLYSSTVLALLLLSLNNVRFLSVFQRCLPPF